MVKMSEEERKKHVGEISEQIDAMGQDSEIKAAKWVIEKGKEDDKRVKEEESRQLEALNRRSRFKFSHYKGLLAELMEDILLRRVELRPGWKYRTFHNGKGVGLALISPQGRIYARGFKPINHPEYDLNACVVLCLQAENCIDRVEGEAGKEEDRIYA